MAGQGLFASSHFTAHPTENAGLLTEQINQDVLPGHHKKAEYVLPLCHC